MENGKLFDGTSKGYAETGYLEMDSGLNCELNAEITKIFLSIGMPSKVKGYRFLRDAVKIAFCNVGSLYNMRENIYGTIAKHFGIGSGKSIERTCTYAITLASNSGKMSNLNTILGANVYANCHEKPPVGEFISLIADKLRLKFLR